MNITCIRPFCTDLVQLVWVRVARANFILKAGAGVFYEMHSRSEACWHPLAQEWL